MPLARWQATIVDGSGNIIPNPFIEVRREIPGAPLASLFSDRDGTAPNALANPFQVATGDGFAAFHVAGDAYKIRVYDPPSGFEFIWRYVGIGLNQESDGTAASAAITLYEPPAGTSNDIEAGAALIGSLHVFKAAAAITGPPHTFNGRPLLDKDGNALGAGTIQANIHYLLLDDETNFYLIMSGAVI